MTLRNNHNAHGKNHVHDSGAGQHVESPDAKSKYLIRVLSFSYKLEP